MAFQPLSVGDVLMSSQTAWKIGGAFRQGRKSAPVEFAEVELQANGLSKALKLVAETLQEDASILSSANHQTKAAIKTILESAKTTLNDLEGFVDRYYVIKKKENIGGYAVERSWSESLLANYKTFKWTTEGGSITDLRNLLQMHSTTINLTMQALQSRSLARLEKTVMPLAEGIANIHGRVDGDMGDRIDGLHRIITMLTSSSPIIQAEASPVDRLNDRGSMAGSSIHPSESASSCPIPESNNAPEVAPPRSSSFRTVGRLNRRLSGIASPSLSISQTGPESLLTNNSWFQETRDNPIHHHSSSVLDAQSHSVDWAFENGVPSDSHEPLHEPPWHGSESSRRRSPPSNSPRLDAARRESTTLPERTTDFMHEKAKSTTHNAVTPSTSPSPRDAILDPPQGPIRTLLPPPALSADPLHGVSSPATPATWLGKVKEKEEEEEQEKEGVQRLPKNPSWSPQQDPLSPQLTRRRTNSNRFGPDPEGSKFEKALFRNSAILCDVRGKFVEITHFLPDEPDPRYNTEMRPVCEDARICVIRRRENRDNGGFRTVTSIWVLSDDGQIRMQQKLSDFHETVPYCSYFQSEKVALQPTDGDIVLRMHTTTWGQAPREERRTTWINYIFQTENDAVAFQSAIYGRMLIGSFHTSKTTVIHEGIKGAFTFEEQFANIEMLRLWEDDGVSTPGATGGVLALMHISSSFGEGWARWWINNDHQHVRVKEDKDPRFAKVKGLDINVVRPGMGARTERAHSSPVLADLLQPIDTNSIRGVAKDPGKRVPVKKVSGVRIEFKTPEERNAFVTMCKRCQTRMLPLPDL